MRWSLSIGTVLGIRLRLHFTFILFIVWLGYAGWQEAGISGAGGLVGRMLIMFLCILLHELGHSIAAMRYGVKVPSITLLPIGGVASMSAIPEKPWQEFVIAVAGPLVNVVIAVLIGVWARWWPTMGEVFTLAFIPDDLMDFVLIMNVRLVVFNLIPAFPMDGGRIFRSLLATFFPYAQATFYAAAVGRFIAMLFIIFGWHITILMPIIGLFVFFGAGYENRWVKLRTQLRGRSVHEIMRPVQATVGPEDRLSKVMSLIHLHPQIDFPVLDAGHLVGLLPREIWMEASRRRFDDPPIRELMQHRFVTVRPQLELARLHYDRRALNQSFFPVVEDGHLLGMITRPDLDDSLQPPPVPAAPRRPGITIDMG